MNRKAVIFGIKGYKLSQYEKSFFKKEKPWGIILFSRNIKNFLQLKNLINNIKKLVKDKKYPILIDMEGGKISRLSKIIDFSSFSQSYFGELYNKDKNSFDVSTLWHSLEHIHDISKLYHRPLLPCFKNLPLFL